MAIMQWLQYRKVGITIIKMVIIAKNAVLQSLGAVIFL